MRRVGGGIREGTWADAVGGTAGSGAPSPTRPLHRAGPGVLFGGADGSPTERWSGAGGTGT